VNEILKQRLVGALILLALGVVFWPIVFVEPEQEATMQRRSMPAPPAVSTAAIEAPGQADLRASPALTADEFAQGVDNPQPQAGEPEPDKAAEVQQAATATAVTDEPARSTEASVVRTEAPQPLQVDADGVPVAWTLQVATVSSAEKAESLRSRLLAKNEKAYIKTISSGGKQLYRVCVGPKFEKKELERIQGDINAEFGVKTMLVRYLP
jgi:DedD protein